MTEKLKTVCVGRYLIDVPSEAEVKLAGERIAGFAIDTDEESEATFRDRVAAREAEIAAHGAPRRDDQERDHGGGLIDARDLHIPGLIGRTFVYDRNRGYVMEGERRIDMESVSIEIHAHMEGRSFSLSATSKQETDAAEAEALLARLRVRADGEIPASPGFCIRRGVFVDPVVNKKNEHVTLHVGLPGHPDLGLAFNSMPGGRTDRTLLARVADMDADSSPDDMLRVTKLRAGRRTINEIDGEEVLERVRELNFTTGYSFMWEARGVEHDPVQPYLFLNMETGTNPRPGGKPVDSSLHEDAVLALWDSISSSIRLRKSGPPPLADTVPEPPAPQLGALAAAGEICPQSGWWKCREGGPGVDVHGGAVQWMRKGDRMPQALLLPRQTLWQKLRGIQPSIEPAQLTTWTLVDKRQRPRMAVVALAQPGPLVVGADAPGDAGVKAALGTYARTGDACGASGWWRCEETLALDGTRWFPRGSTLPPATFQVPAGMFSSASGPEVIQRRSTWQLVRHAEADDVVLSATAGPVEPDSEPPARPGPSALA